MSSRRAKLQVTRRDLLVRGGGLVAATGATLASPGARAVAAEPGRGVRVREGTNIAVAVSPDRRHVAFDLYAGIWLVSIEGGRARRLTDDLGDATQPHFSPSGRQIVFQSYRDGNFHLWQIRRDGGGLRQLTRGRYDHREPKFSPDGRRIAFSTDRDGSYSIWLLDLGSGRSSALTTSENEEGAPAWSPDGSRIAFTVDDVAIDVVELATGARRRVVSLTDGARLYGPAFVPDGRLSYVVVRGAEADLHVDGRAVTRGEDVFGFAAAWLAADELLYSADGAIRRRSLGAERVREVRFSAEVSFRPRRYRRNRPELGDDARRRVRGIASPVLSPDGRRVAFRALNALWLMPLGGRAQRLVSDGYFNSDPDFSPDGETLVYSSDRAGTPALWLHDLDSGDGRRLTDLPGAQIAPRFSPDGARVAYHDHDGATWVVEIATGQARQVLPTLFMPGRVSWSADGNALALAAVKPYSRRFREGTSQILTLDLRSGETRYAEPMPHRSLSTRGDDGPIFSPDGRWLAFVVESVLWVAPVDASGRLTGEPRQVTDEPTDSISWSGDSERLLYLSHGRLRLVARTGGAPRTIPHDLGWRAARPRGRTVIHAGAVWDGRSRRLRHDVDIVVQRDRIVALEGHRAGRAGEVVDASELTVMPGLIDSHNHWHLRGRQWGDRQGRLWLAYGITSTRSPGDPVYQMLETREALAAGERVGPRFFATGEAIDGSRVYYNFMRPTLSERQLELELERAFELEYDLIKTYVRLPVTYQRATVARAHAEGIPLTSHYLYPAVRFGMDGMEHMGATNRLGYSHTVSRLGKAYDDVVELFVRSDMSITPTLFTSSAMYAGDRSLVDDPRTRTLYPRWEYERLVTKADDAGKPAGEPTRAALEANVNTLVRIQRGGGLIIAGTDAPLDNIAISLHMNLRAMVRYGMTPYEALVTATGNAAQWLGLRGQLGTVAPGALADLAFVEGDPLSDIRAAAAVRTVMLGGVRYGVDELVEPFAAEARSATRAAKPNRVLPAAASAERDERQWWHEPEWSVRCGCCSHG